MTSDNKYSTSVDSARSSSMCSSTSCSLEQCVCVACTEYGETAANLKTVEILKLRVAMEEGHDPLQRLPPEMGSRIFELLYESPQDVGYEYQTNPPFILGAVSRSWRSIAWSTPKIWSCVYFLINTAKDNSRLPLRIELFNQYLGKSGARPLAIQIDTQTCLDHPFNLGEDDIIPLVDALNSFASRWKCLQLRMPMFFFTRLMNQLPLSSSQSLRKLEMKTIGPPERDEVERTPPFFDWTFMTSKLEVLDTTYSDITLETISIDFANLTQLAIPGSVSAWLHCLHAAPCLEAIKMHITEDSTVHRFEKSLVQKFIRSFSLSVNLGLDLRNFMNCFTFPDLTTFDIYFLESGIIPPNELAGFLSRSGQNLHRLEFDTVMIGAVELRNSLVHLPSLKHLVFKDPTPMCATQLLEIFFRDLAPDSEDEDLDLRQWLFPRLQCLRLDACWDADDNWDILGAIERQTRMVPRILGDNHIEQFTSMLHNVTMGLVGPWISQVPKSCVFLQRRHMKLIEEMQSRGVEIKIAMRYNGESIKDLVVASAHYLAEGDA